MTQYKIAFFDVDGTLVNHQVQGDTLLQKVPESTKAALKELAKNGIILVIASGRWKGAIDDFARSLGITTLITSNGQEIVVNGESVYQRFIDETLIKSIFSNLQKEQVPAWYDTSNGIFTSPDYTNRLERGVSTQALAEGQLPEKVLQILVPANDIKKIRKLAKNLKVVQAAPEALDLFPFGVSKATGIQILLKKLDIPAESAIAFGDAENDIEMFQEVGMSVAMGNAIDELKTHAGFVTRDVSDNGIYHACKSLKLI